MAHQQQIDFCLSVKQRFPELFFGKLVLDIGSLDINGNNQYLFEESGYIGVDLLPGCNVDFASIGHALQFPDESFDVIISTECFEHDQYYEKTLRNIYRMLKPGGLFLFTCATIGRPEHGTRRTTTQDAPLVMEYGDWGDYYKNLEEQDIRKVFDVEHLFSSFDFSTQHQTHDLYFWGLKVGKYESRNNYSFLLGNSPQQILRSALNASESKNQMLTERVQAKGAEVEALNAALNASESKNQMLTERGNKILAEIDRIHRSISWRITKPIRFAGRLLRGEFSLALEPLTKRGWATKIITNVRRAKNAAFYVARGDIKGLLSRLTAHRRDSALMSLAPPSADDPSATIGIMTSRHTIFVAMLIAERLQAHGWSTQVMTEAPTRFSSQYYIVLCPQIFFGKLPPGEKRIVFQLEQSVSSRWFSDEYIATLKNSLAVLEYSLVNLSFLAAKNIAYPHVHYLPIGATSKYGDHVASQDKIYDVLFYGDSLSSPRRRLLLDAAQSDFRVHIVNDCFGDDMVRLIKQSRVVLNLHYYDDALLEMPRIQECISLGVPVVSESAKDQGDYPELDGAVLFFEQGSAAHMLAVLRKAISGLPDKTSASMHRSQERFTFMFDRFLVAMAFLPANYATTMKVPLPAKVDTFGLSLPETIDRRRVFEKHRPSNCEIFDGIRRRPGWIGCGLSYAALAHHAKENGFRSITVMEDDVVLPTNYRDRLKAIRAYLDHHDDWDIFAGVIASLREDTRVLAVEEVDDCTYVTINRMTSTVFNIYGARSLEILCAWNAEDEDSSRNTIDRFLENQESLRVVVTLPFFVGHREEVHSSLWGFKNTQYSEMILASEALLREKVAQYRIDQEKCKAVGIF